MDAKQIKIISDRHIKDVDKLFRMFGKLSSRLENYKNQILYLHVSVDKNWTKDPRTTALQLAHSWRDENPELKDALKFEVILEGYPEPKLVKGFF
jgi:hypothetical protein